MFVNRVKCLILGAKLLFLDVKKTSYLNLDGCIIVDDSDSSLFYLRKLLETVLPKDRIYCFSSFEELCNNSQPIKNRSEQEIWLTIIDLNLHDKSGLDVFECILEKQKKTSTLNVIISAQFSQSDKKKIQLFNEKHNINLCAVHKPMTKKHLETLMVSLEGKA